MSIDTGVDIGWLEQLIDGNESHKCEVTQTKHDCSIVARWRVYNTVNCSGIGTTSTLWCDVRYHMWIQRRDTIRCFCGLENQRHWNVVPL